MTTTSVTSTTELAAVTARIAQLTKALQASGFHVTVEATVQVSFEVSIDEPKGRKQKTA